MSLLEIEGLSLGIHKTPILKGVSLSVAPGEIVAVTGESGSGKSMTALAVMGLLPERAVATGRILLEGADLLGLSEAGMCGIRGRRDRHGLPGADDRAQPGANHRRSGGRDHPGAP